jgi:hypothetical protein
MFLIYATDPALATNIGQLPLCSLAIGGVEEVMANE